MHLREFIIFYLILSFEMLMVFSFGGFYGDNGIDQTVHRKNILQSEVELIRNHILDMVGLPNRPKKHHKIHHNRRKNSSVPTFLRKVYDRLSKNEDENSLETQLNRNVINEENDGITDDHAKIIEMSDTVMTFLNNHEAFPNPANETRLSFDLSKVSINGINLLMSELHVFKRGIDVHYLASNPCLITIYAVTFVNGFKEIHPIETAETTFGFEGWIQINFTTTFSKWIDERKSNNLLDFTIEYNEIDHMNTLYAEVNSLLSFNDDDQQPFIIAYFASDESEGHILKHSSLTKNPTVNEHRRSKRSTRLLRPNKRHQSSSLINHLTSKGDSVHSRGCQRHTLYITFSQLRWDDWIFAPVGYGAFFCAGSCDFPLPHHVEATNHAVIQQLAHLMQSHNIPKPCCAPSKLQKISLLYENNGAILVKKYRGMIATECACQ